MIFCKIASNTKASYLLSALVFSGPSRKVQWALSAEQWYLQMLQRVALKIHNVCTSHLLGWTTNTLFLHGFRMEPHLHRSEQCIPADLQAQLPLRWQVDLQAHFVVGTR